MAVIQDDHTADLARVQVSHHGSSAADLTAGAATVVDAFFGVGDRHLLLRQYTLSGISAATYRQRALKIDKACARERARAKQRFVRVGHECFARRQRSRVITPTNS